jgi:hypothetical protein
MRHLGSLVLSLSLAAAIWVLTAIDFERFSEALSDEWSLARIYGIAALIGAGILYALLVLPRLSPVGPALAGLGLIGLAGWAMTAPGSFDRTVPDRALGIDLAPARPADLALLLAVPLLATVFSPRRWRRFEPAPGPHAVGGESGLAAHPAPAPGFPPPVSGPPVSGPPIYGPPISGPPISGPPASAWPTLPLPTSGPPALPQPTSEPPAFPWPTSGPPAFPWPTSGPPALPQPTSEPPAFPRPTSGPPAFPAPARGIPPAPSVYIPRPASSGEPETTTLPIGQPSTAPRDEVSAVLPSPGPRSTVAGPVPVGPGAAQAGETTILVGTGPAPSATAARTAPGEPTTVLTGTDRPASDEEPTERLDGDTRPVRDRRPPPEAYPPPGHSTPTSTPVDPDQTRGL